MLRLVLLELGPLVSFWIANAMAGLKPAIAVSITVALLGAGYKLLRRESFTKLFVFSLIMTVLFGSIDLLLTKPIFLRYEATLTNLATAGFFGAGAFGRKPLVMEFANKSGRLPGSRPPDFVTFFRVFTLLWAGYFLAKAILYAWVATRYDLTQAAVLRFVLGPVTFYSFLAVSLLGGRSIYMLLRRVGILALAARLFPGDAPASPPMPSGN